MTLLDMIRRVSNAMGDEAQVFIEKPDIIDYCNDGQMDICRNTEILRTSGLISTVNGTEDYPLPADCINVKRVTFNLSVLKELSIEEINVIDPDRDIAGNTGPPSYYNISGNRIHLYPIPNISAANNIKIFYAKTPVALVNDGDIPEIPSHMHEDIVTYAIARSREQAEDFQTAVTKMGEYKERMSSSKEDAFGGFGDSYPAVRDIEVDYYGPPF